MSPRLCPAFLLMCFWVLPAPGQTDDFTDGNDDGWTRFDPLGTALGSPYALHQVQFGQYRLSCEPSPDPSTIGPARLAAYRADTVYGDFTAVVDVVSWNAALDQSFGFIARVQPDAAPGALNGYALNYQPFDQDIEINRIVAEQPVNLARVSLNLAPGDSYRFVFTGQGNLLQAAVYNLTDPLLPLTSLTALDGTFTSGQVGLFAYDTTGTGGVNVTFDSYSAGPATVPSLTFSNTSTGFTVEWPRRTGAWHLESSTDLALWSDVTLEGMVSGEIISYPQKLSGRRFYRLAEGWLSP